MWYNSSIGGIREVKDKRNHSLPNILPQRSNYAEAHIEVFQGVEFEYIPFRASAGVFPGVTDGAIPGRHDTMAHSLDVDPFCVQDKSAGLYIVLDLIRFYSAVSSSSGR